MMVVPYKPEHLKALDLQEAQASAGRELVTDDYARVLAQGRAFTAISGERVLACGGLMPMWEGREHAWSLLATDIGREFIYIHGAARRLFAMSQARRIEAFVRSGHDKGEMWLKLLGFEREGLMRSFTPDGQDAWLYAMVRR